VGGDIKTFKDFKLYHHFSKNIGNISFKIEKEAYEKNLI